MSSPGNADDRSPSPSVSPVRRTSGEVITRANELLKDINLTDDELTNPSQKQSTKPDEQPIKANVTVTKSLSKSTVSKKVIVDS